MVVETDGALVEGVRAGNAKCKGRLYRRHVDYIAGMCALLLSKHPGLTPFQVKTALYLTAANIRRDQP